VEFISISWLVPALQGQMSQRLYDMHSRT